MIVKAFAKVNLTLDIPGIREDGYHELRSVFQQISLCDKIEFKVWDKEGENETVLSCNRPDVPTDGKNLCVKAVNALYEKYGVTGKRTEIRLFKNIPSGAGLGGGSADCAQTLKTLNSMLELNASDKELEELGVKLGADVPFFIRGGTQLACGVGEKLTALDLPLLDKVCAVIVKPKAELMTANIYKIYDGLPKDALPKPSTDIFLEKMKENNAEAFTKITNALEPAALTLCPEIRETEKLLEAQGAIKAMMTGSGSAVFGIFTDEEAADKAILNIKNCGSTDICVKCRFER